MKKIGLLVAAAFAILAARTPNPEPEQATYSTERVYRQPVNEDVYSVMSQPVTTGSSVMAAEDAVKPTEVKVGLLLPMSGESATLGRSLLEAAELGLFDKYASLPVGKRRAQIVLMPKDTGGTPQGARKAAEEAIKDGVKLLIGPVFSAEVGAIASLAHQNDVRVITFSNNLDVAGNGVYLFGFSPAEQVKRVVREAYLRTEGRIAVLAPNNEYGKIVSQAAREISVGAGKKLVGLQLYEPTGTDIDNRIDDIFSGMDMKSDPKVDAIVLAEGAPRINNILAKLAMHDVTNQNIVLLGTGLWDDRSLLGNPTIAGGMFAGSPLMLKNRFEDRYQKQYKHTPPRLASLAYDAVALAATVAEAGDLDFTDTSLTAPNGFSGPANGIFRLKDNGAIERGLAILALGPKDFVQFAPSPASFD